MVLCRILCAVMDKDSLISELLKKVSFLEREMAYLGGRMERELSDLHRNGEVLRKENGSLRKENESLRERLAELENPKNSRNSSIPPSRDENRPRKDRSLRKATGRKPGGQPGRKGNTLRMVADPDRVEHLHPEYCNGCGSSLEGLPRTMAGARQVVDIPPIRAVWTEYRTYGVRCDCGRRTVADFPQGVDSPVGHGNRIEGLIGYLHARQYLPFKRMKELLGDVLGIGISEGGIHHLLERFAQRSAPAYREIRERVAAAKVVGTDETGARVDGNRHWFWTWQTPGLTYIAHSPTRGKAAVEAHFPQGFPRATLVHDGWRPQVGTPAGHHQICLAHLLRDLNGLNERYPGQQWSGSFKKLLCDAMDLNRDGPGETARSREAIVQALEGLLERPPEKKHRKLHTFYKRMCREMQSLFTFLYIPEVPSDNNGSELAIRNIKVKQKISGQFKKERTAQNFAVIRSVSTPRSKTE